MSVPNFKDLSFYANPDDHIARYRQLVKTFRDNFSGEEPEFISRSPGRVNLIGDHIDYSYFSCLPMAIEVDLIAAVKPLKDSREVVLTNSDPHFQRESFEIPANGDLVAIDNDNFSWCNYFKCGLIVAQKYLEENKVGHASMCGLHITFDGTVPTGGGLSSSAAFCVASTMAVLKANGVTEITKEALTRITVVSEHYVGVNTGGLDQCASVYGEKDKCLLVQFQPKLEGKAFAFPDVDMVFLITNSLMQANKKETAPFNYNLRAVEVAVAAEYLGKYFNLQLVQDSNLQTGSLRGFMDAYFKATWDNDIEIGIQRLEKMLEVVEEVFKSSEDKIGLTTEKVAQFLNLSLEEFQAKFLSKFPVVYEKLKLYQRSRHVYEESLLVLKTLRLLGQVHQDDEQFLSQFGDLMNASQETLRTRFENSTPEVNSIISIARSNGAYGSRITGAGFGGSAVHLIKGSEVEKVTKALTKDYYKTIFPKITEDELKDAITISKPAMGTCTISIDNFL
ncbi:protein Gal3p [[Candida] railenensis]|uniref:Galactokinase n=1 Tax=[Candida] railenensis TaxID=45579 RepID=A0A9P0VWP5_9ASCO|nr:protein Gal3p [[Candida] railenensis]